MIAFVLKNVFVPGSFAFAALVIVAALALMRAGRRRTAIAITGGTLIAYLTLATPFVAAHLMQPFEVRSRFVASAQDADAARGIVVLGGGGGIDADLRVAEAARVYRSIGNPLIVASGGAGRPAEAYVMRDGLMRAGVPARRILLDLDSMTTRGHALHLPRILDAHGIRAFVLVTSETHMPRAISTLRAAGLDPIPSIAADPSIDGHRWSLRPSLHALTRSRAALYEYGAVAYYWSRGWFRRRDAAQAFAGAPSPH